MALEASELSRVFLAALGNSVEKYSDTGKKPIEVNLLSPLPHRIRVYLYTATDPPGGRTLGEIKIQLILPGQPRKSRGSFDTSDERIVLLCGYKPDVRVFVLWDSAMYPSFTYSRNVQVRMETVYRAMADGIALQERSIRGRGVETVIACTENRLAQAIQLRVDLTLKTLLEMN